MAAFGKAGTLTPNPLSPSRNGTTGRPRELLGPDGQPVTDGAGFLLPHYRSFSAVFNATIRTYRWTFDEALRHSRENALAMRRDVFLMGVFRERGLAVVQTPWHVEPERQDDPAGQEFARRLTRLVERTPYLLRMLLNLHEAVWYGRYAVQVRTAANQMDGLPCVYIADHRPVNGDKLQFTFDGVPCVMVNSMATAELEANGGHVVRGERGPVLILDEPYWRDRFLLHTHETDDADFFEGELAGAVHGVGIRSRIYWAYWLRDELLTWAVDYMEKVGAAGVWLFYYEEGNADAKKEAEQSAQELAHNTALTVPLPKGADKKTAGVERIDASTAGIDTLTGLIADYFERHIERYIIGQSLSSKAESTGLGSEVAHLHGDTKYRIIRFDCVNLGETLTRDLVGPLARANGRPEGERYRWVFDLPDYESADKLTAAEKVIGWGLKVKADELRGLSGFAKPEPGDETVPPEAPALPGAAGTNPLVRPDLAREVNPLIRPDLAEGPAEPADEEETREAFARGEAFIP